MFGNHLDNASKFFPYPAFLRGECTLFLNMELQKNKGKIHFAFEIICLLTTLVLNIL